ncbi:hypothetical protein B296_00042235 [Ensete ventricosum]|uniref:Uncharacterized protein n=1 Tax=Ensete ventricosum TaxID=4639 RepID=A0A426XI91_ENSVE|nr:hypothetical protein B296_00042235 [Ensete ventricosum]
MGSSNLSSLSSLLLIIPLYLTMSSMVLATRRAPACKGVNSDTNPGDLAEKANSGTNPKGLAEKVNSGTNPRDFTEKVNSGTNPGDLVEKVNSGTNHEDLAEKVNSGTNPEDLVKKVNSGLNPEDLAEKVNSGKNPRDLAERANSGTNPRDLAERVNSGTNPEELAEKINSGTNPRDLAERANLDTNPGDLAERVNSSTNHEDLAEKVRMTSSDSSSSVRVISSPGSGGASRSDPEAGSSGASSGPSSPVDVRVLRDLEVMKVDHDLDTAVTEGSLAVIRGRYNILAEFGLHVLQPGQRPYSSDAPGMCISVDALEVGLRFPLHPLIEELDWLAHPIGNASPYLSEEEFILVGRLKGILSSSCAIKEMTELWLVKAGLSSASRDQMDLGDLRGMPKMSSDKDPLTRAVGPAQEVDVSLAREAPKTSSKRSIDASTGGVREGTSPPSTGAGAIHAPLGGLVGPSCQGNGFGKFPTFVSELDTLKSGGGPEAVAKAEEHASELGQELEKTKWERDEVLLRLEASEKDLSEVRSNLTEVQRLLKEARVRARKMDDELLQAVKALENARIELPRQAIVQYKESTSFKKGLKRMGRVTYEYRYRVVLACFHARHPDSEVEEDPFTIYPEDDLVPIERQQAFDDSDPPEP